MDDLVGEDDGDGGVDFGVGEDTDGVDFDEDEDDEDEDDGVVLDADGDEVGVDGEGVGDHRLRFGNSIRCCVTLNWGFFRFILVRRLLCFSGTLCFRFTDLVVTQYCIITGLDGCFCRITDYQFDDRFVY